jgi:glycosyltransferase involved in cell wall biosynthesis
MNILVVEPHATGHHAVYLRWLLTAIASRGWCASLMTSSQALASEAMAGLHKEFALTETIILDDLKVPTSSSNKLRLLVRDFGYWRAFHSALRRSAAPVDGIILAYGDYCLYSMAILGSPFGRIPFTTISMQLTVPPANTGGSSGQKRSRIPLKWRMASRILDITSLQQLQTINPSIADLPAHWILTPNRAKLHYLPDPAAPMGQPATSISRPALGIPARAIVVLVYGAISERKGISPLIHAIAAYPDLNHYVLVIAGVHDADIRAKVASESWRAMIERGRIIVLDRFADDAEQAGLFALADIVWVCYRNHPFMSGVLVHAGFASRPVVGSRDGEIGRLITRERLGEVADPEPGSIAQALRSLADASRRKELGERAKRYFSAHSLEKFLENVAAPFTESNSSHRPNRPPTSVE